MSYLVNVFFLCCLMFSDMFHIQMQLMHGLDKWNEYVCMYSHLAQQVMNLFKCEHLQDQT